MELFNSNGEGEVIYKGNALGSLLKKVSLLLIDKCPEIKIVTRVLFPNNFLTFQQPFAVGVTSGINSHKKNRKMTTVKKYESFEDLKASEDKPIDTEKREKRHFDFMKVMKVLYATKVQNSLTPKSK